MRVFFGIGQLGRARRPLKDVVAAIGVFDGVHLGHQDVIKRAVAEARRIKGTSLVVTFHPHPVQVLHPERFRGYIGTISQRLELFSSLGVDACLLVPFTKRFAVLGASDFIERYLVKGLNARKIVVGDDFHFGHDRAGTIRLLEAQGAKNGFVVEVRESKRINNIYIKSSYIRKKILGGDLSGILRLTGRPYCIAGRVVRGDGRGRKLGFPTANIEKENVIIPPSGIYAAHVLVRGKRHRALFYIGRRPSFKRAASGVSLEAHILDHRGDLYGRTISVELLKLIREEAVFPDEKSLIFQMRKDEKSARKYFSSLIK